jgi:hypothetical protein
MADKYGNNLSSLASKPQSICAICAKMGLNQTSKSEENVSKRPTKGQCGYSEGLLEPMAGDPRLLPLVPSALRPSTVVIAVQRPYRGRSPLVQRLPEVLRPGSNVWCTCSSPHRSPTSPQSRPGRSSLPLPSLLHPSCWPRIASSLTRGSFSDSNSLSLSADWLSPPLFDSAALTFPPHIILPFAHPLPQRRLPRS